MEKNKVKLGKIFGFNKRGLINLVIAMLVVGVGGYFLGKHFFPEVFSPNELSDVTPSITTGIVQDTLADKYLSEEVSFIIGDTAPFGPVDNSKFYINYTGRDASELGVIFDDSEEVAPTEVAQQRSEIITTIEASLVEQGFTKQDAPGYGKISELYTKIQDDLVCSVDSKNSGVLISPVKLRCGNFYEYNTDLLSYQTALEFAKSYEAAGNTINLGDTFDIESDEASLTTGYRKAKVSYVRAGEDSGATLSFYKSGDSAWQYFIGTQDQITCDQYNTIHLKAAFKGDTCYDIGSDEPKSVQ